eukprot:CAMPEP_0175622446 /NCGR_PEP_ID=MMETSP0096-20121207/68932_1 /TAXON_ID=311494 /ORGANISM="Alexandrium monilatum, Strain CCMP3105" /LENGTH=88 /DNA_ID=CAMNT_0016927701 /DNA_START=55 /DNA_END=318 /DNA_ORIENTATION=+
MPSNKQKEMEKTNAEIKQARASGLEVLARFEEQVQSLSALAEQYLEQGLLGHHCEAVQMRDRAVETLRDTREKFGLPPLPADAGAGQA